MNVNLLPTEVKMADAEDIAQIAKKLQNYLESIADGPVAAMSALSLVRANVYLGNAKTPQKEEFMKASANTDSLSYDSMVRAIERTKAKRKLSS